MRRELRQCNRCNELPLRDQLASHNYAVKVHNHVVATLQTVADNQLVTLSGRRIATLIGMGRHAFYRLLKTHKAVFADIDRIAFESARSRKRLKQLALEPRMTRLRQITIG